MVERLSPPKKRGYSVNEAVYVSGVGRTKLYEALNAGLLVAVKAGTRTIITDESLEAYIQSLPKATFTNRTAA